MTNVFVKAPESSVKNIPAWMNERFPFANALFCFILYFSTAAIARISLDGSAVLFSAQDLLGGLAMTAFFLLLRIFDEHKDYEIDCSNYPNRVLQSGRITLRQLKIFGVFCVAVQLAYSAWRGGVLGPAITAWLIMFTWAVLMAKEFFCGEWLEQRLTLYAFSHMLIMPFLIWWAAQLANPGIGLNETLLLLALLAFVSGFCGEIVRKTRGTDEERDTVDSYSHRFGTKGSALVVLGLVFVMTAIQLWLIHTVSSKPFWIGYGLVFLGWLLAQLSLIRFIRSPSEKGRKLNEGAVGLCMLLGYSCLIAAVGIEFGLGVSYA